MAPANLASISILVWYLLFGQVFQRVDAALNFTSLPDSTSQAESIAVSTVVYTVAPTGGTSPYNCKVTQQLPGDANRRFDFTGLDLETTQALDYETATQYVLEIECSDSASATATTSLTIDVQDVNDEAPVIAGALGVTINEEDAVGTPITSFFNASDADEGDVLTFSLTGSDTDYFAVDGSSGVVSVKKRLDRDGVSARVLFDQLTLVVTDAAGASVSAALNISLADVNDNTPTFSPSVYYVTVAENTGSGLSLVTVTCEDPDESPGNGDISYAIQSGDDGIAKFGLSGNELQTSSNPIDYDSLAAQSYSYQLLITGTDGGTSPNTGTATVIVQISSVNDDTPAWDTFVPAYVIGQPYDVWENVTLGSTVVTLAATDGDDGVDGTLTYSIVSITDGSGSSYPGVFRVDSVSGELSTSVALDADPPSGVSDYTVLVRATDNGSPPKSVDRSITIQILDTNDNAPSFGKTLYEVSQNEDESATTLVFTVVATDNDATSGSLTYYIESGNTDSKFQIQSTNEIQIQNAIDLDIPSNDGSRYTLIVIAVDGDSPQMTGTTTVIVTITPTNDHDPVFAANYTASIPEDTSNGATIVTVAATDDDYGADGEVTFTVSSGDTGNNFHMNPDTGQVKLIKQIDFDTLSVNPVILIITASDAGGRTDTATVTVSVTDTNDHSPVCAPTAVAASIAESLSTGSDVVTLSCSDQDATDTLTYSITSGNAGSIYNVTSAGIVQLQNSVDFDSGTTSYLLTVDVSDGSNSDQVQVALEVTPVNEHTPSFSPNSDNVTWDEATPTTTTLITFTATDSDAGTHGDLTYAISSVTQSGSSKFQIDSSTGKVVLVQEMDYESLSSPTKYYELTITATDGGGLQGSGTVTIFVQDVNDNSPSCNPPLRAISQAENTAAASLPLSLIASLSCTDQDSGAFGTLTYSFTQTPSGSEFSVDSSTGEVSLATALDYENTSSFTLEITVTDGATPSPRSTSVVVSVSVVDQNDGGPVFTGAFFTDVSESASFGQAVLDVTASDPDESSSPDGNLIYSILSGDPNNQFFINSASGKVRVNKQLDRETLASYAIVIQAVEESGTYSATTTLSVNVTDTNDNPPSCPSTVLTASLNEAASVNDTVVSFVCTDDDGDTVSYTITSGDTTKFQIMATHLTLKAVVDFDLGARTYDLVVQASDGTNNQDIRVTVNILPSNEGPPVFTNGGTSSVDVGEDKTVGSTITTIAATDSDSADTADGQVTYSFVNSYPKFGINTDTGAIILQSALDRETTDSYELLVKATNGALSATATLSINVTDVNDNAPTFNAVSYSGSVSETDVGGANVVVTVTATDSDDPSATSNGEVVYSIAGGNLGGVFTIDANTGDIRTTTAIDYDSLTSTSYSLTVVAADRNGGTGSLSTSVGVTIIITNVNDNTPVFSQSSYNATIQEDANLVTLIVQLSANDADSGPDGDFLFSMATHSKFRLDQTTGDLTLKDYLDYETQDSYTLNVVVTDKGLPAKSSSSVVYIDVTDVNDNTPECIPASLSVSFREDISAVTTIATLSCSDLDSASNSALTYNIHSVNSVLGDGPFQAMSNNTLVLSSVFDYETTQSYDVLIEVTDGGSMVLTTTAEIVISVSDVNEHDPQFTGLPYSTNVAESAAVGDNVFQVGATDGDSADTLTFSLGSTSSVFALDPISGIISVKAALDYETKTSYNLSVVATDSGTTDSLRSTSTSVAITITDVNDNSPVFTPASYSHLFSENTGAGTTILSLTATDADDGSNGDVTYGIQSGNTGNVFRVEKHIPSGECILIVDDIANLDFETLDAYTLVVTATDGAGLSADANVYLTVTAYNEYPPVFTPSSSSTENVAENSGVGMVVIDLNATDADSGPDGDITYSIQSGGSGQFAIEPATGVVLVSGSIDAEMTTQYTLDIVAVDDGTSPSAKTATYSLTVDITDVNDETPLCTKSRYSATIAENTGASTSLVTLDCSDNDKDSPNNALIHSITGGSGSALFDIDPSSGEVTTAGGATFDRETTSNFSVILDVSDQGSPSLTTTVSVDISIADENDNDPQFCCSPYSVSVGEEMAVDSFLIQITATDADSSLAGTVIYSISAGNTGNKFIIDSSTGDIRTAAALDRESVPVYDLVIQAADLGTPQRTSTATLLVNVTDFNDNYPACSASFYYGTVEEGATVSTSVTTVSCTDADEGTNAVVTYSLLPLSAPFSVNSSSGLVDVSGLLDAEAQPEHTFIVMASDGTLASNVTVMIKLTDINEHPPAFSPNGPYSYSVYENDTVGYIIAQINATDSDVSGTADTLTFSITAGNVGNAFQITPNSGVVRLSGELDYETFQVYELEITVSDGLGLGALSSSTTFTVSVLDINDNQPVCDPEVYFHMADESDTGVLLTLNCTDVDSVSTVLNYNIVFGNTNSDFVLDTNSGALSIASSLDFESTEAYDISVEVSDGSLVTTALVAVKVEGVNEFDPEFGTASYQATVPEDSSIGSVVETVTATDRDNGTDGLIRYSIVSGNSANKFTIEESTGVVKVVGQLNREQTDNYILGIRSSDNLPGSSDERSVDVALNITIADVNDNYPIFSPPSYVKTVAETATSGSTVLWVTALDDDQGLNSNLVYSVTGGNGAGIFNMTGNGLEIAIGMNLDYETATLHSLTVEASDQGSPPKTSYTSVVIQVLPVNEFTPTFSSNESVSLQENTAVGTPIFTALASDLDSNTDGDVVYSISTGNSPGTPFYLDSRSGILQVWSPLDFDTAPDTYTLEIVAEDRKGNSTGLSSTMTFSVSLTDVNDETPIFSQTSYYFSLDENVSGSTLVGAVNATDRDSGANGNITFTATSGDTSIFDVDPETGEIVTATMASIDYETKTQYSLVIHAVDAGSPRLSVQCIAYVTIIDLNDNPPVFQPSRFTVSISEDTASLTPVTSVVATDADTGSNAAFTFDISPADTFSVHPTSGVVSTAATLDRETDNQYVVEITAIDKGSSPLTGTCTLTIVVSDVNDNPPAINGTYDISLPEDTAFGTVVLTIKATDNDAGENADLTYNISDGNTNLDWQIESAVGIIQIAKSLDRETTPQYKLVVVVSDKGSPAQSASVTVSLTITDVNDNAPVFSPPSFSFSIHENVAIGTPVGRITATDADTGLNSALQYKLLYVQTGLDHFAVDLSTAQITTSGNLDREQMYTYVLVCRVYDKGTPQLSSITQVTITVTDMNDNRPLFGSSIYSGSITENSAVGTSILSLVVTDNDTGPNAVVSLSIDVSSMDGPRAEVLFSVDSNTGILSVKQAIDRETDSALTFNILSEDGGTPALNDSATVSIAIQDENDNSPVFTKSFVDAEVAFDGKCSNLIASATATDADQGSNALVNYYLVQNADTHLFGVDSLSGAVTLEATAVTGTIYLIYIMAQDMGTTTRTSANNLAIRVDAFDPTVNVISFKFSVSKSYFTAHEQEFVDQLTAVFQSAYTGAVVRSWCTEEREGQATDPSTSRRRLLATGDKPATAHVYVLKDSNTNSVSNVGVAKNFLTPSQALSVVADGSSPSAAITGAAWSDYGIVGVDPYVPQEEVPVETPWIQTTTGIAVVTSSVIAFILLIVLITCIIFCCKKRRKRPITPDRPQTSEIKGPEVYPEEINNSLKKPPMDVIFNDDLKKGIQPAVLALPIPQKPKQVNSDVLRVTTPNSERPLLSRDFDGMAVDPVTGKMYEYNTRTKERRWLSTGDGKAVMASNGSNYFNYHEDV